MPSQKSSKERAKEEQSGDDPLKELLALSSDLAQFDIPDFPTFDYTSLFSEARDLDPALMAQFKRKRRKESPRMRRSLRERKRLRQKLYMLQYRVIHQEKLKKYRKEWISRKRKENPDLYRAQEKAYREKNKERLSQKQKEYRKNNRAKMTERNRLYRENNREKSRAYMRAYMARYRERNKLEQKAENPSA